MALEVTMPRYFFDVETANSRLIDRDGDSLAGDDLARDYAWAVLVEQIRSTTKPPDENQVTVSVRDEIGPRFRAAISVTMEDTTPLVPPALRKNSTGLH